MSDESLCEQELKIFKKLRLINEVLFNISQATVISTGFNPENNFELVVKLSNRKGSILFVYEKWLSFVSHLPEITKYLQTHKRKRKIEELYHSVVQEEKLYQWDNIVLKLTHNVSFCMVWPVLKITCGEVELLLTKACITRLNKFVAALSTRLDRLKLLNFSHHYHSLVEHLGREITSQHLDKDEQNAQLGYILTRQPFEPYVFAFLNKNISEQKTILKDASESWGLEHVDCIFEIMVIEHEKFGEDIDGAVLETSFGHQPSSQHE